MKLNNVFVIAFVAVLVAASGCISQPAPSPTPTATPTLAALTTTPEPTDNSTRFPSTIGVIQSGQLTIENVKISYAKDVEKQAEVFQVLIKNNGFDWANNTIISLRVTDAQTDQYYFADQFPVGNISPNESQWFSMTTASHDYASSVLVKMDWFWGDNMEFSNSMVKSYSLAFLPYS
jgi:hypothetical protein